MRLLVIVVAVAMKTKRFYVVGSCCCRSCKRVFDCEAELSGHLSYNGYCNGGADRVVRDFAQIILNYRRLKMNERRDE